MAVELNDAARTPLWALALSADGAGAATGSADKDVRLRAALGVDYSLTRNLVLRAGYTREQTTSNVPGNNLSANVWLFGARWQW